MTAIYIILIVILHYCVIERSQIHSVRGENDDNSENSKSKRKSKFLSLYVMEIAYIGD